MATAAKEKSFDYSLQSYSNEHQLVEGNLFQSYAFVSILGKSLKHRQKPEAETHLVSSSCCFFK